MTATRNRIANILRPSSGSFEHDEPKMAGNGHRPKTLEGFVGQGHLKAIIRTSVIAARKRNAPFPHALLSGQAGMGKTALAALIASEMGVHFIPTTADALSDSGAVKGLLSRLDDAGYDRNGQPIDAIKPSVLLIDEAHRLPRQSQELMYACVEDRVLDAKVKDPLSGLMRPTREWVPHFTLLAATNRPGDLTQAFRDRLRLQLRLEPYSEKEACLIARQAMERLELRCGHKSARMMASRGRGVPRRILSICEQVRDMALATGRNAVSPSLCMKAFDALGLDPIGLERSEVALLTALASHVGQPLGLKTLASIIGEDERSLEDAIEPYLLAKGMVQKTARGRCITEDGLRHLEKHHGFRKCGRSLP